MEDKKDNDGEIKEDWAQCLIGRMLADIHTQADKKRILKIARDTPLGVRYDLMKVFNQLIEMKEKAGLINGV